MSAPPRPETTGELALSGLTWRPLTRAEPTIAGLDLAIPAGERVLLAGASGSGKSTVLRALAGLLDPETGQGTGVPGPPDRPGERGLLLQNPADALVAATIRRDVAFGPENAALSRPAIGQRVADALPAARVELDLERAPLETSGGQQQRIALAGALALRPDVLLLDEPTSMLDAATAEQVRSAILTAAGDRTLVLAEHRIEPWLPHVDRLVVLGPQARILLDVDAATALTEHRNALVAAGMLEGQDAADGPAPRMVAPEAAVVAALHGVTVPARGLTRPVDLTVRAGSLGVLTGPSGAGKTTLLRVLTAAGPPALGTAQRPAPSRLATVPQDPEHSFVAATVAEELRASPWADDEQLADQLLERADLVHLARANPHRLSGGEQRRVAIAAALAQKPDLLVLDEPTVGLDARRREAVLGLLEDAAARGCAVLAASHDPSLIARAGDRFDLAAPDPEAVPRSRPRRRIPADALNPLTLCLIGILAAIGSFAVQTWQGGLLALVPLVLLGPLAVRSLRGGLLRLVPIALSAASLAWTTALLGEAPALSGQAWLLGLKEAARIGVFVAPGVLALGSVAPTPLGDALGGRLHLPARPVAAGVLALVRVGHLGRQWEIITRTRIQRGLGSARSPQLLASATLALLVDTLRGAEQQALAMDARGFSGATDRTWAEPSEFGRADVLGALLALVLLVWPAVAEALVG
ncbi:ATP-binding cassette domain-containing protein [Brachybacterium fresconis]|uniref:Energy-coupling factor transport system ATP-binding protein n=1 Tax=Brachybacterium fresconis TaxID=173363 RepID=A0ABS4YQ50_9MICO|nr:ATP-binding cassette domain-containing protein [Brachybacterium fresconis]MBP2410912.1 energy-coupling factor transport system ATP-binding protein [Brachybacterium fresconis]